MGILNTTKMIFCGALLFMPMWAAAQTVTSFTVVNTDTGADIATFTSSGSVSIINTPNINVRANASGVNSVVFTDGKTSRTENNAPYAYKSDVGGRYNKWSPVAGTYYIHAKPFSGSRGRGVAGAVATLTLTITDGSTPTPTPVPAPTSVPTKTFTLSYQVAPADNPLKGFLPYAGSYSFPHSMEWFYIPLKDIQVGFNVFDWRALDSKISAIAARGHQATFRVYLDYPGSPSGMPGFLSGVPMTSYGNGSSPDYNNPDLQTALLNFIAALGARYDKDPRIGFITAGLLGKWGEWHTYPQNNLNASPALMNQVVDAYERAFPRMKILAREPKTGVAMDRPRLGFHDDSFAYQTLAPNSSNFWPKITAAGLQNVWKRAPIGGEVRPEVQGCIWNDTPCTPTGQGFDTSVSTTHASWMLNQGTVSGGLSGNQLQRAIKGAQSLGYTLHIPTATLNSMRTTQALHGTVTIENRGVAPFYYPWTVQMAALDAAGNLKTWSMDWDLSSVLPGSPSIWDFHVANPGLTSGTYTLLMGVMNPMMGGKALKFANTTQDQQRSNWLTLGTFVVTP